MGQIIRLLQTDEHLVELIRQDNDGALAFLYEKNIRMIMKYVLQNNGTEKEAISLLQDALVILWEKVKKQDFTLKSRLSTYLYGVVKNLWLRELARQKKMSSLDALADNPGHNPGLDEALESDEMKEIVKSCLARLSEICRNVLIAFYYEELSMQEISRRLGLAGEDVAKSKKYQCKKELERLIKQALK
jgi:RNA polymerase sigma factor (sigma-70 family)